MSAPGGFAGATVCLTFDVDAESVYDGRERVGLSSVSHGRFGIVRGLPRLLGLLDRLGLPATFYVPGMTARRHPDAIRAIVAAGHELGHHGHRHLESLGRPLAEQRRELDDGLAALHDVAGVRPAGYRSPSWELTAETLGLLVAAGFAWDSSCMGDDRPYVERRGELEILELPVHWSLDDWPFFGFDAVAGGRIAALGAWLEATRGEIAHAAAERRAVTVTMHPEVIGRGYRFAALERLLQELAADDAVRFLAHRQLAAESRPS